MTLAWSRFTAEQMRAAFLVSQPMLAAAGAGAGKTAVMAVRYCACLLDHDEEQRLNLPERVLAVTFTKAAAANLRARIDRTLRQVIRSRRFPRLISGEGMVEADLDEVALAHLRRCLGDLPGAPIATFDALCRRWVTEHAASLGRDPDLKPPEDLAWKLCGEEAWAALRAEAGTELVGLVEAYGEKTVKTALVAIAGQASVLPRPEAQPLVGDPVAGIRALRQTQLAALVAALADLQGCVGKVKAIDQARAIDATPPAKAVEMRDWIAELDSLRGVAKEGPIKSAIRAIQDALDFPNQRTADSDRPGRSERCRCASLGSLSCWREGVEAALAKRAAALSGLVARYLDRLDRAAARAGLAGFSRVEAETLRLLGQSEASRLMGRRYRHVLLDEAQDLNRLQGRIVELLQAGGGRESARVFTVGDHRQSIFGFRHAAPELFQGWERSIADQGGTTAELVENFRSHPDLVARIKAIFSRGSLGDAFRTGSIRAGRPATDFSRPGALTLWRIQVARDDTAVDLRRGSVEGSRAMARQLAALVAAGIAGGRAAEDHAILLRSRSRMRLYATELERSGIAYDTDFPGGLYDSQECHDLEAILRLGLNPGDRAALAIAVGGPWGGDDPQDRRLMVEALSCDAPWAMAAKRTALGELVTGLSLVLKNEGVAAAIRRLMADPALAARYGRLPLARRRLANLARLAEEEDAAGVALDVAAFVARLAEHRHLDVDAAEASGESLGSRGVRLSTVHGAKGLEWPVVFLPEADQRFNPRDLGGRALAAVEGDALAVACAPGDSDVGGDGNEVVGLRAGLIQDHLRRRLQAEEARLLYVACTRAEEELHVLVAGDPPFGPAADGSAACWGDWLTGAGLEWREQQIDLDRLAAPLSILSAADRRPDKATRPQPAVRTGGGRASPASPFPSIVTVTEMVAHQTQSREAAARIPGGLSMSQSQARAMGVAVHAALARFGPGMAAEQAAAALAPFRGTLGRLRYERLLKHLADRDLIPGYWSARLRLCEQPVVTNMPEKPGELLLGVCDVLLQDAAGSWRLYDYKTGGAAEAEESRAQVRLYAKMLAPHLDGPLARLGVVDVETGTVVEVEA